MGSVLHIVLPVLQPGHGEIASASGVMQVTGALFKLAFASPPSRKLLSSQLT